MEYIVRLTTVHLLSHIIYKICCNDIGKLVVLFLPSLYAASIFEPLGGVMVGVEDRNQMRPALFVVSCGEGHLDLRTADKVMQTLLAKDSGQSGLPSPATIISEKNYIIVWEINSS